MVTYSRLEYGYGDDKSSFEKDNVDLKVLGSSSYVLIGGNITITTFPSISTDIFYDIDRAVVLATLS